MTLAPTLSITHDSTARRFHTVVEGELCVLDYRLLESVMTITHTGVPQVVGGRGIAAQLVSAALNFARQQGLRIVPACSYAAAYFRRHAELRDLLA